jgi:hypothetical protein
LFLAQAVRIQDGDSLQAGALKRGVFDIRSAKIGPVQLRPIKSRLLKIGSEHHGKFEITI